MSSSGPSGPAGPADGSTSPGALVGPAVGVSASGASMSGAQADRVEPCTPYAGVGSKGTQPISLK